MPHVSSWTDSDGVTRWGATDSKPHRDHLKATAKKPEPEPESEPEPSAQARRKARETEPDAPAS